MSTTTENRAILSETKESTDATYRLKSFTGLSQEFENVKKNVNNSRNLYVSRLFSLLGYNYKGKVDSISILHLVSEAFLLGVFEELKKENKDKTDNIKYNELLSQLNWIIVQENVFLDNMKILTGIYDLENTNPDNTKIFKMFLVNLQSTKNDILKNHERELKDENLTRATFDEIMTEIFSTAFNYTLNEFNSSEEKKKNLSMYHLFNELREHHPELFNLKAYSDEYIKRKKLTDNEANETKPYLENFFNYSITGLDDLFEEIELFNRNSTSLLYKIKTLISIKNIRRVYQKYYELVTSYAEAGLKNARLEAVLNFYKSVHSCLRQKAEDSLDKVQLKYRNLKKWVNENQHIQNTREFTYTLYQNARRYTDIPVAFINEKVYQPLKNVTLTVTDKSVHLLISLTQFTVEQAARFRDTIFSTVERGASGMKNMMFGEDALVKVHSEKDDYVSIELNKKLFIIDPHRATEYVKSIISSIREFSITETVKSSYNCASEKAQNIKNYVYESYRKFLELANEDENRETQSKKAD